MGKPKVILVILAFAGMYFVAAGGFYALLNQQRSLLEVLGGPMARGNVFDTALAMMALIVLFWGLLPAVIGERIGHAALLQGVALGSALVATGCIVVVINSYASTHALLCGIFALVALLQGTVGITAALLMIYRRESRTLAVVPLALNGGLTAFAIAAICGPLFL